MDSVHRLPLAALVCKGFKARVRGRFENEVGCELFVDSVHRATGCGLSLRLLLCRPFLTGKRGYEYFVNKEIFSDFLFSFSLKLIILMVDFNKFGPDKSCF